MCVLVHCIYLGHNTFLYVKILNIKIKYFYIQQNIKDKYLNIEYVSNFYKRGSKVRRYMF